MRHLISVLCASACLSLFPSQSFASEATSSDNNQLLNLTHSKKPRFPTRAKQWPQDSDSAVVCLWKDGRTAAFSLTIDDNWATDCPKWLKFGEDYGWKWTWFIVTGGPAAGKNPNFAGSWEHWQSIIDKGHDVQSHTKTHRNKKANVSCEEDYGDSLKHLQENLTNQPFTVLAYPGGGLPNDPEAAKPLYIGSRGVYGVLNDPLRINYMSTSSVSGLKSFWNEEGHWASYAGMTNPDNKKKYRAWMCTHYHGIKSWEEKLPKIFDKLKEDEAKGDIWVATFREVVMYGQQRDTAQVSIEKKGDKYELNVTDSMKDEVFNYPLTIKWKVPAGWDSVNAKQGEENRTVRLQEHNGAQYAFIDAVPDAGVLILSK